MTTYCLTVDVNSDHIEHGLGYMISFRLPGQDSCPPEQLQEFSAWQERVKEAVLRAGEHPFSADPYTKKLAIAELMHELDHINRNFSIQIGAAAFMPAVQIQSSDPLDRRITIDFSSKSGRFSVSEHDAGGSSNAGISSHGRTTVIQGQPRDFPFIQSIPPVQKKKIRGPVRPGF